MEDYIAQVHAAKRKKTIIGIAAAVACILLLVFIFVRPGHGTRKLTEEAALSRVPALALTAEELALAETILEYEDFRSALSYDLVDNVTTFTPEDTASVIGSVIPDGADPVEISVSGAVVIIDCTLPQHRIVLEYADADRSGTVDILRKTLTPIINGASTGCYTVELNLSTSKIAYTHRDL